MNIRTKIVLAMTVVGATAPATLTLAYKLGKKKAWKEVATNVRETVTELIETNTETTN